MAASDKSNVLIFDEQGFFYGSTQKLERQMAKILAKAFKVYFAGGPITDPVLAAELKLHQIDVVPFTYSAKQAREPFRLYNMQPKLLEIIRQYNIHCIYTPVYGHYQFPLNSVPASIPFVLISPFGHFATNGNVPKIYVSGKSNAERLHKRGVKNVELFFNPLEDYPQEILQKPPLGEKIVFGRIGRGEDGIFDPIALKAFKKLEDAFPSSVKYLVVNPPPAWEKMAKDLAIKNMEFLPAINDSSRLAAFYRQIDVLAHARKDGETVGMAIAEAMLAGNPILTHRSSYHNEHFDILDPAFALWADIDDSEKYFQNMKWMIEHREKIREMGRLARAKALEIFGMENQTPKIIASFQEACQHYYHDSFLGRLKGYAILYWQNLKSMPFLLGKIISLKFPKAYSFLRGLYYE